MKKNITLNIETTPNILLLHYLDGYFQSVVLLCDKLCNSSKTLFFPCTFAISQYMELWIKILIKFYKLNPSANDIYSLNLNTHNSLKLITQNYNKFKDFNIPLSKLEDIKHTYEYFSDFASADLSEAMRFPIRIKNDDLTINQNQCIICIEDDFKIYKEYAMSLLQKTNDITKEYFKKYIQKIIKEASPSIKI